MNATNQSSFNLRIDVFAKTIELTSLIVLFTCTVIGNSVVLCYLLYKNKLRKTKNNRHTLTRMSFYIVNLSVADIIVAFLSVLTQIIWRFHIIFPFNSNLLCKLIAFGQVFPVYGSTFNLIAMAYDRFTCVCNPMSSFTWTYENALLGTSTAWLIAALISSPQLFIYSLQEAPMYDKTVTTCWINWKSKEFELYYLALNCIGQFFVPLALLSYFYARIFRAISINVRLKKISSAIALETTNGAGTSSNQDTVSMVSRNQSFLGDMSNRRYSFNRRFSSTSFNNHLTPPNIPTKRRESTNSIVSYGIPIRQTLPSHQLSKSKLKTLKLTLIVVIAYLVCTAPYYIGVIWYASIEPSYNRSHLVYLFMFTHLLFQLNSCINPFIYLLFNCKCCKSKPIKAPSKHIRKYTAISSVKIKSSIIISQCVNNNT